MSGRLYLKKPGVEDKDNVLDFKREFLSSGQKMAGVSSLDSFDDYGAWLEKIKKGESLKTCAEGRVPASVYLSYRKSDNKLIGILQIRHYLNDFLLEFCGHIGDCVRPTEQGKGYATEQISLALKVCEQLGIDKVLITCKKENVASARTIIKNAGVLENEVEENGEIIQRYWIDISQIKEKENAR